MQRLRRIAVLSWALGHFAAVAWGSGRYVEVEYPPSDRPDELQIGVTYTLWLPDTAGPLRGLIVHQHGCGSGACKGGETAAYDLHWQALAEKWHCGLLGPSYKQQDGQNCRLWCDPRKGSRAAFLKGLGDLAEKSGHPEVATVPWCLWGHSGGGFWVSLMQISDPERVVAVWCRSGTAFMSLGQREGEKPHDIPEAVYQVPVMCNPGAKENGDERFNGAWKGTLEMFQSYRKRGAPIGFAPDPRTGHECGESRYLAIPYFDACLALRLPASGGANASLRPVDPSQGWLADALGETAVPASQYKGKPEEAVWLPNEAVAKAWMEYVKTGSVGDPTPPPAPSNVVATRNGRDKTTIRWDARADLESGLREFLVLRDGAEIGRVPEKPAPRFGRPLFQRLSYHDTPERPLPEMTFVVDGAPKSGVTFQVIAVNAAGEPSQPATANVAP